MSKYDIVWEESSNGLIQSCIESSDTLIGALNKAQLLIKKRKNNYSVKRVYIVHVTVSNEKLISYDKVLELLKTVENMLDNNIEG